MTTSAPSGLHLALHLSPPMRDLALTAVAGDRGAVAVLADWVEEQGHRGRANLLRDDPATADFELRRLLGQPPRDALFVDGAQLFRDVTSLSFESRRQANGFPLFDRESFVGIARGREETTATVVATASFLTENRRGTLGHPPDLHQASQVSLVTGLAFYAVRVVDTSWRVDDYATMRLEVRGHLIRSRSLTLDALWQDADG